MPLSPPADRKLSHIRRIESWGYERADGLFDIEGVLHDSKTYGFDNQWRGRVEPGQPVHEMWVRMTVDEDYVIRDMEATSDATPFQMCGGIAPDYKKLIGLPLARDFKRQMRKHVGSTHGCTHLSELIGRLATVAFQTIGSIKTRRMREAGKKPDPSYRPAWIDTCHAWATDSPVLQQHYPQFYTGPGATGAPKAAASGD
ncbi:MAG: DUF2889 domain-containing protein [Alphaproteobacteria bacterium]|nr:DUF2889 domain-containing protein [Alphaproteobacteria bacterium]